MSWEPKFSQQVSREKNCGQHCISMITHIPISVVVKRIGHNGGTSTEEVAFCLYQMGYYADHNKTVYRAGMPLPDLCIIHIHHHWCLHFKGKVYCSVCGIYDLYSYLKRNRCRIKSFIKVEIPNG